MVQRIRHNARAHLFIEEHMEAKGLSFEDLGSRLDVSRTTVWRWAKEQWRLNPVKIANIADALGLHSSTDLYRPPKRPSIDAFLDDAPDDVYDTIAELTRRLTKRAP